MKSLLKFVLLVLTVSPAYAGEQPKGLPFTESTIPYRWGNVVVGGGGWMVSLAVHPRIPDLLWLGSDVSGPWKLDPGQDSWCAQGWNTWTPQNASGVLGLALDPRSGDTVYVERGSQNANSDEKRGLYITRDGGRFWALALNKYCRGNFGPSRKWGPSIAVDPSNPDVVYYGTFRDGIWRSQDAGRSWNQVMSPPSLDSGQKPEVLDPGVRCLAIDPSSTGEGRSSIVYASLSGKRPAADKPGEQLLSDSIQGLYRSTDGGNSFKQVPEFNALPGNPRIIFHMYCGTDGTLFVNHSAGLARLDHNGLTNVTPRTATYFVEGGLAVNPANPKEVLLIGRTKQKGQGKYYHLAIFRSRDRGETWSSVVNDDGQIAVDNLPPWLTHFNNNIQMPASASFLAFDPFHPGRAYLLDAFGVYRTEDIWANKVTLHSLYKGAENTVVLTLCTPPPSPAGQAAVLFSGLSDVRGFRHADIHMPPLAVVEPTVSSEYDWATYVTGYDYCEGNPAVMFCVKHHDNNRGKVLRSTDGGTTWKLMTDPLGRNYGGAKIAVSAKWDGSVETLRAVFAPGHGEKPRFTPDGGKTWAICKSTDGAELGYFSSISHAYSFSQYVAADRVDGDTFYLYSGTTGTFWVSRDGGETWKEKEFFKQKASVYDALSAPSIQAAPGRAGEVWAAMSDFGIKRTRDFGDTWESLGGIVQVSNNAVKDPDNGRPCLVTFGTPAPGKPAKEPTVFVFVRLPGDRTHSLLRSSDIAREHLSEMNWERSQKWEFGGILPTLMQGSRQKFGQVFMSSAEHGIIYGAPVQ